MSNKVKQEKYVNANIATMSSNENDHFQNNFGRNSSNIEYGKYFDKLNISYIENNYHLQAGSINNNQGWMVHLSTIYTQYVRLLEYVLPILKSFIPRISIKILRDLETLKQINNGYYGTQNIGKSITILIDDECIIDSLLSKLIPLVEIFTGPEIPGTRKISKIIYYRYGSFKPLYYEDGFGNRTPYILDMQNNAVEDNFGPDIILPGWLNNPFEAYTKLKQWSNKEITFKRQFQPVFTIKNHSKGDVYKGVRRNKFYMPRWCIIKQGRIGIFSDILEADARHRLVWEYKIANELNGKINVPKMHSILEEEDETLITMDFISGQSVTKETFDILNKRPWFALRNSEKIEICKILIKIIQQIRKLHTAGFWHRDITGNNFIVDKFGKIWLIDLELAYNFKDQLPEISFGKGTPGYMSPNQSAGDDPTLEDDIYGLGSLMILCMTGIEPSILNRNFQTEIKSKINFFLRDIELSTIIAECIDLNPSLRPSLIQLEERLTTLCHSKSNRDNCHKASKLSDGSIDILISSQINNLLGNIYTDNNLWFSHRTPTYDVNTYPLNNKFHGYGMAKGIGGVLYTLAIAKKCGYNIDSNNITLARGYQYIGETVLKKLGNLPSGLHYGSTGIALLLSNSFEVDFIPQNELNIKMITDCCTRQSQGIDLINGSAGDGLAILQCSKYLPNDLYNLLLTRIVSNLIKIQNDDGSWPALKNRQVDEMIYGFGYGAAGIVYFLLEYGCAFNSNSAIISAEKGLSFLIRHAIKRMNHLEWDNSSLEKARGAWWCHGSPGIALCFLKAYQLLNINQYRLIAEKALRLHPENLVSYQLASCHGISGLGEIYLEAYKITKSDEWMSRATWIANLLETLKLTDTKGNQFWIVEQSLFPTADMMLGNSGIIHFFLRYSNQDKIYFPLLK